jgi:superfamily II helicase
MAKKRYFRPIPVSDQVFGQIEEKAMTCQRCGKETRVHTMSRFNTQVICMDCAELEMKHKDYKRAYEAELEATRAGNMNFPGIGKPFGL